MIEWLIKNQATELNDTIKSINDKIESLREDIVKGDKSENLEMEESIRIFKASIKELSDIQDKYCKKHGGNS
jgi:hypothetical protein